MNKTRYERAIEKGLTEGRERGWSEGIEQGIEQGIERGIEQGRLAARFEFLEAVLENKFGPLTAESLDKLRGLTEAQMLAVVRNLISATSLGGLGL